jgi:hypothetical protein
MDHHYHQWSNIITNAAIGRYSHHRLLSVILTVASPFSSANVAIYNFNGSISDGGHHWQH